MAFKFTATSPDVLLTAQPIYNSSGRRGAWLYITSDKVPTGLELWIPRFEANITSSNMILYILYVHKNIQLVHVIFICNNPFWFQLV